MNIIAFDGPTAVGKSTQIEIFCNYLDKIDKSYRLVSEYGGIRDFISQYETDNYYRKEIGIMTESFLWFAHYSNRLEENIYNEDRPDYLLLDRYLYTSIIYQYILLDIEQVSSFREFSEIIERIFHFGIFNKVKNNTSVIIFSANIDALAERFQKRENRTLITEERTILERSIKYYNDNSLGWISGIKNHLNDTSYKSIEQVAELILNLDL